jgi:hypothetical protein
VAAAILAAVEGGCLAARKERWRFANLAKVSRRRCLRETLSAGWDAPAL